MVIGMKYGKVRREDTESKERTYAKVGEFVREFEKLHPSSTCTGLLGYNLSDPDQLARAREQGVFKTHCPRYVHDAVEILERII